MFRQTCLLLLFTMLLNTGSVAQETSTNNPYANSHFLVVDSLMIHYREWNGQADRPKGKVVLIHGFIGSTYCWRYNSDALAGEGYRVVAVDLPSFGYSDRSLTFNQSQSNRGLLLWKLLDSLDRGDTARWHICGHSMGGGTAEAMALLRPSKTRSLTIVDGMVFHRNTTMESQFTILSRQKQYNRIMTSYMEKQLITYKRVKKMIRKNYRHEPDSAVVLNYLKPLLIPGTAASILNVWANAKEVVSLNSDSLTGIPVLVVWGKKDRTIFLRTGKRFLKHVPHAQLVVIHSAGHDPMETHPDIFNSLLTGFLNRY